MKNIKKWVYDQVLQYVFTIGMYECEECYLLKLGNNVIGHYPFRSYTEEDARAMVEHMKEMHHKCGDKVEVFEMFCKEMETV